jgi:tRNA nucleotidyltransferase (CCA-adding enzyme)
MLRDRVVEDVVAELQEVLPRFVRPRLKVRDLMSYSVRTVSPETKIAEVSRRMLHTGHEGFPVLDEGRVVGLVTRNAVDRALQHGWDHQPVRRVMEVGEVTVSPQDSSEHVRDLMIQHGWGQIPVVEEAEVTGVVTRTDLIRLPPSQQQTERRKNALLMEQAFPKALLTLIRKIGEEAAERSDRLYFVGGIVRDLLLGEAISDVDLVVEGDAIGLAEALTAHYGGEIRMHQRFGTAKWLLAPEVWRAAVSEISEPELADLPAFIDLVTARTEFYTRPTALPKVEWSSIKQDLHRRDFTINTLAIRLSPGHWGEMLDFFGGKEDLEEGVIRVLHSLSFVDDPTRILRAARFEARLGFHLDPRSEALIGDALPLLDRVTGGRVRHELELIFREERPEAALERLRDLGALQQIDPVLEADAGVRARFVRLRETLDPEFWKLDDEELIYLMWALFLYGVNVHALKRLVDRLMMPRRLADALLQLPQLPRIFAELKEAERPGGVVALLSDLTSPLLAASWLIVEEDELRERIVRYWTTWRHVEPRLDGHDLQALGFPTGPIYSKILNALREARLNGEVETRADEVALAKRLGADVLQKRED